jgi:hypothetical protein
MVFKDNIIDTNKGESGILFSADSPVSSFTNNEITIRPSITPLVVKCVELRSGVTLSNSVIITGTNCIEK